jgi:primase-polymerase (primpol)-like protein
MMNKEQVQQAVKHAFGEGRAWTNTELFEYLGGFTKLRLSEMMNVVAGMLARRELELTIDRKWKKRV